jgi:hypothetical protein
MTHTHTHAHTRTHTHAHTHTHTHTHTHKHTHTDTHTHTHTHKHTHTNTHIHTHTPRRKHANTHANTQTHTLALALSLSLSRTQKSGVGNLCAQPNSARFLTGQIRNWVKWKTRRISECARAELISNEGGSTGNGINWRRFKHFKLNVKASIWPCLSCIYQVRWTEADNSSTLTRPLSLAMGLPSRETRDPQPKPKTRSSRLKSRNLKPEIREPELDTRNPKPGTRNTD